jgi:hypothetical protein
LIEAKRAAQPLDIFGPHAWIGEEDRRRPAGRGVNQEEDTDRDQQQERDGLGEAVEQQTRHRLQLSAFSERTSRAESRADR